MKSPANWLLPATFLVAATAFALYEAATSGRLPGMGDLHWPLERTAAAGRHEIPGAGALAEGPSLQADPVAAIAPVNGGVAGDPDPEAVPTAEQHDAPLIAVATGSSDLSMRAEAVTALRQAESADGIVALGQVVMSDPSPRVRSEAINSLRVLFVNDYDADGAIRAILQSASSDRDPGVAALARETYREILALLPTASGG